MAGIDCCPVSSRDWVLINLPYLLDRCDVLRLLSLQIAYILLNPHPPLGFQAEGSQADKLCCPRTGEKDKLDFAQGTEVYHQVHQKYHPTWPVENPEPWNFLFVSRKWRKSIVKSAGTGLYCMRRTTTTLGCLWPMPIPSRYYAITLHPWKQKINKRCQRMRERRTFMIHEGQLDSHAELEEKQPVGKQQEVDIFRTISFSKFFGALGVPPFLDGLPIQRLT